jgi:uncharacterized coiled-coil protein SlyX
MNILLTNRQRRQIQTAIRLARYEMNHAKTPHERDKARCKLKVLTNKLKEVDNTCKKGVLKP